MHPSYRKRLCATIYLMNIVARARVAVGRDRFLRNNIVVFIGSIVSSALSYLYYPIMARILPFDQFGEVQTLVSLLTQVSLIFSAINIVAVVLIASSKIDKRREHFILELQKLMVYVTVVLGLVAIVVSPLIKDFFHFESVWPLISIIVTFILMVPLVFWNAYLQGKEQFGAMSVVSILGAAGKLVFAVIFVLLGFGALGAALGLLIGQIVTNIFCGKRYDVPRLKQLFKEKLPNWQLLRLELGYTVMVVVVSLSVTLLYSGDILLIKHYFSPEQAGIYAGIASIARIIFFLTLSFAVVLLPAVHSQPKVREKTLKRSFIMVIVLGSLTALVFWLFAPQIVTLLVGARYADYAYLLPELSLAVLLISIANLLFYYMLSVRNVLSLFISLIGLAVFFGMSFMRHATIEEVITNLTVAAVITVVLLVLTLSVWPRVPRSFANKLNRQFAEKE